MSFQDSLYPYPGYPDRNTKPAEFKTAVFKEDKQLQEMYKNGMATCLGGVSYSPDAKPIPSII